MPKNSKLHGPLLTHMRAVAYAPVQLSEPVRDDAARIAAAKMKRERKQAKRVPT